MVAPKKKSQSTGKSVAGYLQIAETGKGPGVLVLHAWWGLTPFFRNICSLLAQNGFVAFAPDLYNGKTASTIDEARKLRSKLKGSVVSKELTQALEYLRALKAVGGGKIGVVGFSLGAYWTLGLAGQRPADVSAVVVFYGTRRIDFAKSRAAFLGHFAEDDRWAPVDKVGQLESQIRAAGRNVTFHIYPGTKHWFFEADRSDAYDPNAANLAWNRTLEFLKAQLAQ